MTCRAGSSSRWPASLRTTPRPTRWNRPAYESAFEARDGLGQRRFSDAELLGGLTKYLRATTARARKYLSWRAPSGSVPQRRICSQGDCPAKVTQQLRGQGGIPGGLSMGAVGEGVHLVNAKQVEISLVYITA